MHCIVVVFDTIFSHPLNKWQKVHKHNFNCNFVCLLFPTYHQSQNMIASVDSLPSLRKYIMCKRWTKTKVVSLQVVSVDSLVTSAPTPLILSAWGFGWYCFGLHLSLARLHGSQPNFDTRWRDGIAPIKNELHPLHGWATILLSMKSIDPIHCVSKACMRCSRSHWIPLSFRRPLRKQNKSMQGACSLE